MKKTTLRSIAKAARNQLKWPSLDRPEQVDYVQVFTDQRARAHTFIVPADSKLKTDYLAYLHSLGRAVLCEQVHPLFSANSNFAATTDQMRFAALAPALKAGTEWFVNCWLMQTCPERMSEHLRKLLAVAEQVIGRDTPPPPPVFLDAAQSIALALRYLNEPIDCGGILQQAVAAYQDIDPAAPSKEACEQLVNRLMAFYTPLRARLVEDNGCDVWEIFEPATAAPDIATTAIEHSNIVTRFLLRSVILPSSHLAKQHRSTG